MARHRDDRFFTHRVGYVARVLGVPLLCLVIGLLALRQAGAADSLVPERSRVDQPAPATPLLSARRLPDTVALPGRTVTANALVAPVVAQAPSSTSCAVVSTATGTPVFEHNALLPVVPASNQKILTAYTVLARLGPDFRYRTQLVTDAQIDEGVVEGDVWLVGSGDPVLATSDYALSFAAQPQRYTPVEELVAAFAAQGITRVRGALIGDATRYDDQRWVPTWPQRYRSGSGELPSGPLSALNLTDGFTTYPAAGQEYGGSGPRTVAEDPAQAATARVAGLLAAAGITVEDGVRVGPAPPAPIPLAAVESAPMSDLVRHMLAHSDNTAAELFLKELAAVQGGRGSTAAGAAVVAEVLAGQGFPTSGLVVADGSGLDPGNRVTCRLLALVLALTPPGSAVVDGLPVAGQSGTLADRFLGTPAVGRVRAKTGTLAEESALSGYVDTDGAGRIVFATVLNGGDPEQLEQLEEQLAVALLAYPLGPTAEQLGPRPPGS